MNNIFKVYKFLQSIKTLKHTRKWTFLLKIIINLKKKCCYEGKSSLVVKIKILLFFPIKVAKKEANIMVVEGNMPCALQDRKICVSFYSRLPNREIYSS